MSAINYFYSFIYYNFLSKSFFYHLSFSFIAWITQVTLFSKKKNKVKSQRATSTIKHVKVALTISLRY